MSERRKKSFRKFNYRGLELKTLIDLSIQNLVKILPARARRKLSRGLQQKPITLIRKLRKAKKKKQAHKKNLKE